MSQKIPVCVLAATGSVGQRFISLLNNHPWFEVVEITASDKSIGRKYSETCHWLLSDPMPEYVKNMEILATDADTIHKAKIVFSALPADIAKSVEPEFAKRGFYVCSNASAYRKDPLVPILLPEINADHIKILDKQQKEYNWKGGILTDPNCTSAAFVVPLGAISKTYNVTQAMVFSMQAISGAGYPGVASMDIIDNVIPFISGEEEKVEWEALKMMGDYVGDSISLHKMVISAHTNRVAVVDAHTICLSFSIEKKASIPEIIDLLKNFRVPEICRGLPSCPEYPIIYHEEENRPQPRLDRMLYKGMSSNVGRLRPDKIFDYKMVTVQHNTIRGAAGGSIVNAELLAKIKFGFN